jgi:alkanesulfonate monooxygenase SsuD/methylene tetrahydromethanopterin reductase-like flavin-dependent oxidoreductase (luciferase family)
VHSALFIPLFDELADPARVAGLAAEAEEAGWDGIFVWDHIRFHEPVVAVADTQVTLAAIAAATERIRLGPMVTPLARRRPVKVARETATLDRLSGGRLTLGVGLGSDQFGAEWSTTGEELDDRTRARMLDESLEILQAAWSGELVEHRGDHYTVDSMRFEPRPVQRPGVPVWVAGFPGTAERRAETRTSPTTSSPPSRSGSTRRPTARRAPRGGRPSSRPRGPPPTECAASSARARRHPRPAGIRSLA